MVNEITIPEILVKVTDFIDKKIIIGDQFCKVKGTDNGWLLVYNLKEKSLTSYSPDYKEQKIFLHE